MMQKPEFPRLSRKVRNRLAKLADFLETFKVPKGAEFDLAHYAVHPTTHAPKENNYCGTAACALGWAALSRKLTRSGLRVTNWYRDDGRAVLSVTATEFLCYGDDDGIQRLQFKWLFLPEGYTGGPTPTPKRVAKRIREVLRDQESAS